LSTCSRRERGITSSVVFPLYLCKKETPRSHELVGKDSLLPLL